MNRREYFLTALKAGLYLDSEWVFTAFSQTQPKSAEGFKGLNPKPYALVYAEAGFLYYEPVKGAWTPLEDVPSEQVVLYTAKEPIEITPDEILLPLKTPVTTTYGRILANYVMLYYPFKGMLPYLNDQFNAAKIEASLAPLLHDNPPDDGPGEPGKIYVKHYLEFAQACMYWFNFTQLFIPGDTEKSLQTHPDMSAFKAKLVEKYKGRLNDQAVLAEFEAELEALDMEWLKDDPSLGLLIFSKDHKVVRKKLHRTMGHEQGFSESVEANPIINSLYEGWDLSRFTDYNDGLRSGVYDRGAQTSKGGELVKWLLRASGTVNIVDDDCGTTLGSRTLLTKENIKNYLGFSYVAQNGKAIMITEENAPKLLNRRLIIRSMMFCSLPETNRCAVCAGSQLAENPTGASSAVTTMGDIIMNSFMKSMHGRVLSTAHYDINKILT